MKKLCFIWSGNGSSIGGIAVSVFAAEADRTELDWQVMGVSLSEVPLDRAQLMESDLIIGFDKESDLRALNEIDRKLASRSEFWKVDQANNAELTVTNEIKKLCVKLILQGGKRKSSQPLNNCPTCRQPVSFCKCKGASSKAQQKDTTKTSAAVRVLLDRKGRGGKDVTVITGLPLEEAALNDLGRKLKAQCGAGGTVKDGCIEIQGDRRDFVISKLQDMGYKPKKSGG